MNTNEYFTHVLAHGFYKKRDWYYGAFMYHTTNTKNSYVRIANNYYEVLLDNGEYIRIDGMPVTKPLLSIGDKVSITNTIMANLTQDRYATTIGRAIVNKILLADCFGNVIEYVDKQIGVGDLEEDMGKLLLEGIITVEQRLKFVNACTMLGTLDDIFTISVTPRNMMTPPNMDKYRERIMLVLDKKYGGRDAWTKDRARVAELEDSLSDFHKEWLKDDPAYGKYISNKVFNNAMAKQHRVFGSDLEFDKKSLRVQTVTTSLADGYPSDPASLTKLYNTSRSGSNDRGNNTQLGGVEYKNLLRRVGGVEIIKGDCGSTRGTPIKIVKNNIPQLVGSYMLTNNKPVLLTTELLNSLLGRSVPVRSPMYCLQANENICTVCIGESAARRPNGVGMMVTEISNIITTTALKSMHSAILSTVVLDLDEAIT